MDVLKYVFDIIMVLVLLSGIWVLYCNFKMYHYVFKGQPEKILKYIFSFRADKLLNQEGCINDPEFTALRSKQKKGVIFLVGVILFGVTFVLITVLVLLYKKG